MHREGLDVLRLTGIVRATLRDGESYVVDSQDIPDEKSDTTGLIGRTLRETRGERGPGGPRRRSRGGYSAAGAGCRAGGDRGDRPPSLCCYRHAGLCSLRGSGRCGFSCSAEYVNLGWPHRDGLIWPRGGRGSVRSEEVPAVAGDVEEDGVAAVGLGAGFGEELDAGGEHASAGGVEVLDAQEESDPAGVLVADGRSLSFAVGAGEQSPVSAPGGRTTTQRFGRPSLVRAGESSASSNPRASVKNAIAES